MKHISFIILFITTFSLSSYAQTEKGKIFGGINSNIGGFYNETNHKYKDDVSEYIKESGKKKSIGFNISPQLGYFVADNLAIGVNFNYSFTQNYSYIIETNYNYSNDQLAIDKQEVKEQIRRIGVGTFARYYFLKGQFRPFAEANIGLSHNSFKHPFYKYTNGKFEKEGDHFNKETILTTGLGAGVAYFLNDNLAIEGSLNYNFTSDKCNRYYEKRNNDLSVNFGFSITF